jgi:hypothetical protein
MIRHTTPAWPALQSSSTALTTASTSNDRMPVSLSQGQHHPSLTRFRVTRRVTAVAVATRSPARRSRHRGGLLSTRHPGRASVGVCPRRPHPDSRSRRADEPAPDRRTARAGRHLRPRPDARRVTRPLQCWSWSGRARARWHVPQATTISCQPGPANPRCSAAAAARHSRRRGIACDKRRFGQAAISAPRTCSCSRSQGM